MVSPSGALLAKPLQKGVIKGLFWALIYALFWPKCDTLCTVYEIREGPNHQIGGDIDPFWTPKWTLFRNPLLEAT